MKKILIIPAIAALTLCACGGGNSNQNSGSQNADTVALPDYIAHAICKQINPKETPDTATATGDLNGDGIKDSAAFNNGFSVYFGSGDGKYNLLKKYKVYPHETNDYVSFTTSVKINNGKLIISTRREGDGWENYDYTAKFQDGDFVIVNLFCDEGLDGSTTEVLNFEEKTYKGDFDECEGDSYTTTAKLKNLPLPKLSAIQIGGNSYEFFHKYIDESTSKTTTE